MRKQECNEYINSENLIGHGKEGNTYRISNKVIKIFHKERKSPIPITSDEGLRKLTKLNLACFNNPIDVIEDNGKIIGTIENYIENQELTKEDIASSLDDLHEDIKVLSDNGFTIEDMYYNYTCSNGKLKFFDMTSYQYINTKIPFMLERIYKKNIEIVNIFLTGYLMFDAFRKGNTNEYTKIYKATTYNQENIKDQFFGDYIRESKNEIKSNKKN